MFGGHDDNAGAAVNDENQAIAGGLPNPVGTSAPTDDSMPGYEATPPSAPTVDSPGPAAVGTVQPTTDPVADEPALPVTPPAPTAPQAAPETHEALMGLKQQALQQLTPLVGHLDQTPEEKFRTTMMMIQASDNQELIKDAYAAAEQITDEKAKAQALLDIVNEINYFTHHNDQSTPPSNV